MPDVGAERIDLLLVRVERESVETAALLDPERLVEAPAQLLRLPVEPRGELTVAPDLAGKLRDSPLRVVDVALHLARSDRRARKRAVVEALRVPRVLPRLVVEPA